ncbi:DUF4383 domain-containing protein [Pseudonocardia alni]|nr:hypothetical protein BG618_01695 [Pseudonocardia autotrophica]
MPTQSQHHSHGHAVFPWPQLLVVLAAFLLLLYGLLGFRYSGLPGLPAASGELLGIGVDPLRDLVHLVLGVAGLPCATRLPWARGFGVVLMLLGAAEVLLGLLTGVFRLVPAGPFATNAGSVLVGVLLLVLGAVAVFGRAFSDAPYAGLQRGVEAAGRRVTGLRDRSVHAGTDDVGTEDRGPAAWSDEPAGDGDRSGGHGAARGPR